MIRKRDLLLLQAMLNIAMCLIVLWTNPVKVVGMQSGNSTFVDMKQVSRWSGTSMTYQKDVYDCTNFTDDFIAWMDDQGAYCRPVIGCDTNNKSRCHKFATCDIEPQTLEFVNYQGEYPMQRRN
jgi:hypothetical protein